MTSCTLVISSCTDLFDSTPLAFPDQILIHHLSDPQKINEVSIFFSIFMQQNAFEHAICKTMAISFKPHCIEFFKLWARAENINILCNMAAHDVFKYLNAFTEYPISLHCYITFFNILIMNLLPLPVDLGYLTLKLRTVSSFTHWWNIFINRRPAHTETLRII